MASSKRNSDLPLRQNLTNEEAGLPLLIVPGHVLPILELALAGWQELLLPVDHGDGLGLPVTDLLQEGALSLLYHVGRHVVVVDHGLAEVLPH